MFYSIVFFDEVKKDVREAKAWYRQQGKGLDKRFAADIKLSIDRLSRLPFSHAVRYLTIRIVHPDLFPYSIHYYIENNVVVIVAVVHNKRDSYFIKNRL